MTKQTCMQCTHAQSIGQCQNEGAEVTCTSSQTACQTTISFRSGRQTISKQCQSVSQCVHYEQENRLRCTADVYRSTCKFCCTSLTCNNNVTIAGYGLTMNFYVNIALNRPYSSSTKSYQKLSSHVTSTILELLKKDVVGRHSLRLLGFTESGDEVVYIFLLNSEVAYDVGPADIAHQLRTSIDHYATGVNELNIDKRSLKVQIVRDGAICTESVSEDSSGRLVWPATKAEQTVTQRCPIPMPSSDWPVARRRCVYGLDGVTQWLDAITDECAPVSHYTHRVWRLLRKPRGAVDTLFQLADISTNPLKLNHVDVSYIGDALLTTVAANTSLDVEAASRFVVTVNNLLRAPLDTLVAAERLHQAPTRLLTYLEEFATSVAMDGMEVTFSYRDISVSVVDTAIATNSGITFTAFGRQHSGPSSGHHVQINTLNESAASENLASIHLPASIFQTVPANRTRVQFVIFHNDNFFKAMQLSTSGYSWSKDGVTSYIISDVISASFDHLKLDKLLEPVSIILRRQRVQIGTKTKCAFWDFSLHGTTGGWSSRGCNTSVIPEDSLHVVCTCDHLTNFALIMDVYGTAGALDNVHQTALSAITYVGCGISLAALFFTLLTHLRFRKLYRSQIPSKILTQLCFALTGVLVTFIFSTQKFVHNDLPSCQFFAVLLHYFLLSTWTWMAVEAFFMHQALVKVFKACYSMFIQKCCVVAWGIPSIVVVITLGTDRSNYGLQHDICLLLKRPAFFGALLAPVLCILVANCVVFILVLRQLRNMANADTFRSTRTTISAQLRRAVGLMILLGFTWLFAFFAVGSADVLFNYAFAVFNSLQGLFIFVFYCAARKEVRRAWMNSFPFQQLANSDVFFSNKVTPSPPGSSNSGSTPAVRSRTNQNSTTNTSNGHTTTETEKKYVYVAADNATVDSSEHGGPDVPS